MMKMENEKNGEEQSKVQTLKNHVDSVKQIMVDNVERILERGERLDNIERRSEQLNETSANFKLTARKVQRKFCMLNAKWTIILTLVITVVLIIIILIILGETGVIGGKKND